MLLVVDAFKLARIHSVVGLLSKMHASKQI